MAESENQTEMIAERLAAQRQALTRDLHQALSATLFDNRAFIRPADLKRIAEAEADAYLDFVQQADSAVATNRGAQLCRDGLGKSSVLRCGRALRGFCHAHLEADLILTGLEMVEAYHNALMQGYLQDWEATVLKEQEQMRAALQRTLSRYALQMEVAAEVATAATSILSLNELLNTSVELIRERFDLYYVGVFLVDDYDKWAILRAGSGQAGQEMLRRGHKLEVGGNSMIGWCVAHNEPRIALEVGAEAVRFDNPMLPETRSEMALPLTVGGKVIGGMTVQSTRAAAFSEQDVAILRIIADQLANAVQNSHLFAETHARLEELQAAHRHYLQEEWAETISSSPGYLYQQNADTFMPVHDLWRPKAERAVGEGRPIIWPPDINSPEQAVMAAPITLRGQVIGALNFLDPARGQEWTEDDLALVDAVVDQAALAIENARLFEQTQEALQQTQALYSASRRIVTATGLTELYQAVVDELGQWLQADQCRLVIFDSEKGCGEIKAEYRSTADVETLGIPMKDNPSYEILRDTKKPLVIEDVTEHPATHQVKEMFAKLGIKSVLLVPIVIRDELVGSVGLDAVGQKRVFTEDELNFCQIVVSQATIAIQNMRALKEQQEIAEQLREADKFKTQFLANMSHELRTPLNSIIGFSRVILKGIDGPLTELQTTDLAAIYNSGQHLLGIINNILDLSKIEAGKMELNFEEVELKQTIKGIMSAVVGLVKDKPIELEQQVPDDLPNIWADGTRVRQILLNLVSNAAKFTEEGKITVIASHDDEWVTMSVADTGIGIPQDKLTHIFQEFTQVDASSTRRAGGTGLGLPISRHFVEMHGGEITVESQEGVGTVFTFTLPIHPQEEHKTLAASDEVDAETPDAARRLVLAVDDDAGVISLYKRYLEGRGYQVIGVSDSNDVLDKVKELQPFAITLDVIMPNKDGWQVLRELKECPETQHIPIIFCSIVSDEGRGFSLGAADYLVKPIMEDELLAALSRLDHMDEETEVLVIDDQADDILLIRRILEAQHGYRIIEASSGQIGIDLVRQRQPDIIILDLMMPEMNGFAVLEILKREPETRAIPVIVITAKELTEEERQFLNGQVEVLLRKGLFTERELLEDVGEALQRAQSH
jgi:signal transduction histidine kinase/CheY-like chemotaxis protein/putative methionine-R-sulfoxide reductase with GAF domain